MPDKKRMQRRASVRYEKTLGLKVRENAPLGCYRSTGSTCPLRGAAEARKA